MTTDSLLAFKSAIITCFGYYFMTTLKLLYKDGRPFWLSQDIVGYRCRFDFGGPSYHLYTLLTFWVYNIIMYQMKYTEDVSKTKVYVMFGLVAFFGVWTVIAGLHQGTTFLYQDFMGFLYGGMVLVISMNFDTSIHLMCEKTGFIIETSRKYKFYLFFLCLGLFVPVLIYYLQMCDEWISPQMWLDNSTYPEDQCIKVLFKHSQNRIGLDQTFNYVSVLFFIVGMGFGTSYSITQVDCLDWVHTGTLKKVIRGVIGCSIIYGITFGCRSIETNDEATIFVLHNAFPALICSLFIFGIFPAICLKVNLVDIRDHEESQNEFMTKSTIQILQTTNIRSDGKTNRVLS